MDVTVSLGDPDRRVSQGSEEHLLDPSDAGPPAEGRYFLERQHLE